MRRLVRYAVALTILAAAIVSAARWIGRYGRPLAVAAWFTNPDGATCERPCLFGIIPGETSYQDAIRLIEQHSLTRSLVRRNFEGESVLFATPSVGVVIWGQPDGTVARVARLRFNNLDVGMPISLLRDSSLVELILYLGSPTNATYGGDVTYLQYRACRMRIVIIKPDPVQQRRLEYEEWVFEVALSASDDLDLGVPWRGFTISTRYLSAR